MDPTIAQVVDAVLAMEISDLTHQIRVRSERLAELNQEWTRRHQTERCFGDCREPRAPFAKVR